MISFVPVLYRLFVQYNTGGVLLLHTVIRHPPDLVKQIVTNLLLDNYYKGYTMYNIISRYFMITLLFIIYIINILYEHDNILYKHE